MSRFSLLLLPLLLASISTSSSAAPPVPVTATVSDSSFTVDESYVNVNIDAASLYAGLSDGRLNFTNPSLLAVAKRLGPCILRVGGSSADGLGFNLPGTNTSQQIQVDGRYFSQLLAFARSSGFKVIFNLNFFGLWAGSGNHTWDPAQAKALLAFIAANGLGPDMYGFQLGNEPGHWATHHNSTPSSVIFNDLAEGFLTLKSLLNSTAATNDLKLIGPDVCFGPKCGSWAVLETILRDLYAKAGQQPVLDTVSVHVYPEITGYNGTTGSGMCNVHDFMSPLVLDTSTVILIGWRDAVARALPSYNQTGKPDLQLLETASGGDGGCGNGLSNGFISGFFWVDQLGHVGQLNYTRVFRQDLVGWGGTGNTSQSRYALAGEPGWTGNEGAPSLIPNPDYYTTLLWKATMGTRVLKVAVQDAFFGRFRVYAHCAASSYPKGAVAIAYVSLITPNELEGDNVTVALSVSVDGAVLAGERHEFRLSPPAGQPLTSRSISLNGGPALSVDSALPPVVHTTTAPFNVPPSSYGFVVWPNADHQPCL